MEYLICIPVYKVSQRVYNCMESIQDKNVLIIDNTGKKECSVFEKYNFKIEYQKENIGIPKSWNIGLKKKYDWTFIVSSSMFFKKPFSHIIEIVNDYEGLMFRTNESWHCIGINKKLVENIGYFDENFYPGYYEDCDWDYRCSLFNIKEFPINKIEAKCQISGAAVLDGLKVNNLKNRDYFIKKWGAVNIPNKEYPHNWGKYKYPFNNPNNLLNYWQ
jgi:hypothetical protein